MRLLKFDLAHEHTVATLIGLSEDAIYVMLMHFHYIRSGFSGRSRNRAGGGGDRTRGMDGG